MTSSFPGQGQTSVRDDEISLLESQDPASTSTGASTTTPGVYSGTTTGSAGTSGTSGSDGPGKTEKAKEAGSQIASSVKDQAGQVAGQASQQARDLVGEGRHEALRQVSEQQRRLAESLRRSGDDLRAMADSGQGSGVVQEVAWQASTRVSQAADWFEQHEPAEILDEVRDYARRHPWTFLAGAALAGLAVGRLGRAGVGAAATASSGSTGSTGLGSSSSTGYDPLTSSGGRHAETPVSAERDPGGPFESLGGDTSGIVVEGTPAQSAVPPGGYRPAGDPDGLR